MRVEEFFSEYASVLTADDLEGISRCYGYPSLIVRDDAAMAIGDETDLKAIFEGSAERYRAQGFIRADPKLATSRWITERLVEADVRWNYIDAQGVGHGGPRYRYTLRDTGQRLVVHVIVVVPDEE